MSQEINCKCGECKLIIKPYIHNHKVYNDNIRNKKAGVIIHNSDTNHVLLVQSRGNLWGFPKGSLEKDETFINCAIRELKEETNIDIDKSVLKNEYEVNEYAKYYYVNTNTTYENIKINNDENNDASGLFWINLNCLKELLVNDIIKFNYHAKKCLYHFFKISRNNF
jgi:hypothetical protein